VLRNTVVGASGKGTKLAPNRILLQKLCCVIGQHSFRLQQPAYEYNVWDIIKATFPLSTFVVCTFIATFLLRTFVGYRFITTFLLSTFVGYTFITTFLLSTSVGYTFITTFLLRTFVGYTLLLLLLLLLYLREKFAVTLKVRFIVTPVIADLQAIFKGHCVSVFVCLFVCLSVCICAELHMRSFSGSFVADIMPRAKENVRTAAMILFQIVPNVLFINFHFVPDFSLLDLMS
jgi:hypothetical protein